MRRANTNFFPKILLLLNLTVFHDERPYMNNFKFAVHQNTHFNTLTTVVSN